MLKKSALLCSMSVLLAACGDSSQTAAPTVLATTVSQKSSAAVVLAPTAYYDTVQRIYVGYFGRPADQGGLEYFAGLLSSAGAPNSVGEIADAYHGNAQLRAIVEVFSNSQESQDFYAGNNTVFIEAVYRNLFGREADAAGKAYWVALLNAGTMTRVNAALQIMAGARDTDILAVNKRVALSFKYMASITTPARKIATEGNAASIAARNLLATLNLGSDINAYQPQIDAVLADLVAKAPPAGIYSGKLNSNNYAFDSVMLEDGQYWGFYSSAIVGMYPSGFVQGKGTWGQGTFNSDDVKDFGGVPAAAGYLGAVFSAQSYLNGTIGVPNGTVPFSSPVIASAVYDYFKPAAVSTIAGTWSLIEGAAGPMHTVSVAADGKLIGGVAGCNYAGTLTPRASRKNIYDASLTYSAGTCRLAGQTATGIAFTYEADASFPRRLFLAVTNPGRTAGSVYHTGLVIQDTVVGTGEPVTAGKTATMNYTGWLYNGNAANLRGTQFDTSIGRAPFVFTIGAGSVIKGWDNGIVGMRVGGKRTLILSAQQAYGAQASASIPANSTLIFDVEMVSYK